MYPRDQWAAKQMTYICARVAMNFPWTREDQWSIHESLFSHFLFFFFNSPPTTLTILCAPSSYFPLYSFSQLASISEGAKRGSTVVLELKSLTRRCHSAVPHHCFPIMGDFGLKDSSSFSNVWAFSPLFHTETDQECSQASFFFFFLFFVRFIHCVLAVRYTIQNKKIHILLK